MSRSIPTVIKDRAFQLWLQGASYREIRDETRLSLGAISSLITSNRAITPDLDQLKALHTILTQHNSTVFEAIRGGRLLDRLNHLDVNLPDLEAYIQFCERISQERGTTEWLNAARTLQQLVTETGKSYHDVIADYQDQHTRTQHLQERETSLSATIRDAEQELSRVKQKLIDTRRDLERQIEASERLQRLGIEKTNSLAAFINEYEHLGFDSDEVKQIADWRSKLTVLNIDLDTLREFLDRYGPLNQQLDTLNRQINTAKRRLSNLQSENKHMLKRVSTLQENYNLPALLALIEDRTITLTCQHCGSYSVRIVLPSLLATEEAMNAKKLARGWCPRCSQWSLFTPWAIVWTIARMAWPSNAYS